jgi:uncharacterized protein involved in high-affinity Fe2+ transport
MTPQPRSTFALTFTLLAALVIWGTFSAMAGEQPIGEPFEKNGMQIGMVYLQAVAMSPHHAHHENADIHLEADVKAMPKNSHGFPKGSWIPGLDVDYAISKTGSDFKVAGKLVPMAANDGPHYGENVKLTGPGKYTVKMTFKPAVGGLMRHTDKETGVPEWWKEFSETMEFVFVGSTGKKGGY